jgi:carboxymethylenebutenolidase
MPYDAILAETISMTGHEGQVIEGYLARPMSPGPYGGVVVIHHMPGYDRGTKEIARRFADAGYAALMPNLYHREAPGAAPDDAAATARAQGGVPDERLIGDVAGAAAHLRGLTGSNGRIGVIGYCSGGRQSVLAATAVDLQAAVDCYGAFVVEPRPDGMPSTMQPIIDRLGDLRCPLLGLFGAEDSHPSPEHVAQLDKLLADHGKEHEFHTFPDAGHAFFAVDRPAYRPAAAVEGWATLLAFFATHLAG